MARISNIKLRRSATQGSIPTTANLDLGELAINTYDGKLYVKKTFGSLDRVVQVGSSSYSYNLFTGVTETLTVTVASSTSDHRYNGTGSSNKYFINGLPSPYLKLVPGVTYQFDQSDSSNSGHPLVFYYEANKTTSYSTGVTTNGTPGSAGAYTQIIATDATPPVLHYQCSAHANMGNQATFSTRNLTGFDTDDLTEGSSNLYYTDARAQAVSINNVVEDTTPQLGGTLDTNNQLIQFGDSSGSTVNRLQFGASQDFEIYHDGTQSIIDIPDNSAQALNISEGSTVYLTFDTTNSAEKIVFNQKVDINGKELVLDADGDTSISAAIDDLLIFKSAGTSWLLASANVGLSPNTPVALGNSTHPWTQLYVDNIYVDGNTIKSTNSDGDLIFKGNDGGSEITALTLDMSDAGSATFNNNVTVTGNLTVQGTTTTLNTATLDVEDKNITLNFGSGDTSGSANGAGITIQDAVDASNDASLLWDATNDRFDVSHPLTITSTTTDDTLLLTTTEASSSAAPVITLKRNSSSVADADYLGQLKFKGENDADQEVVYAKVTAKIQDASDGSEDGLLEFANKKAGSNVITARLRSDSLQLLNGTTLVVAGLTYPTSDGSSGQALVTDGSGNLSFSSISAGGNAFGTVSVSGQSDVVADSATDTLTLAAGSGMTITTNATSDTITFASSGGSNQSAVWTEYVYTATSNQTTFTGSDDNSNTLSYTPGFLQVYINGVLQDNGTDYTATNGTSVVLVNGAATSDLIQIATFVQILGSADAVTDEFTGDGSTTAFTLTADPDVESNTMVFVDGVYQEKATYSISGTTLTFSGAPANGQSIEVNTGSRNVTVDDVNGLTIEGNLVVEGNTTLGNASGDTITVTGTPTFAETATFSGAIDANNTVNVSGHLSLDGSTNELRFYEGSNYVGFEAPALSGDQIWVLPDSDGTAGYALKTDGSGNLSWGLAGGNAFETIAISGQSSVVADSSSDTLTLAAGTGITLTTNASTDTITITNSSLGANAFQNIAVSGQTTVAADSTGDTVTLVGQNGVTITTTAGTDTVTFDGNKSINPFVTDLFTSTASQTDYTLSTTPSTEDNLIVFVEGVYQNKNSYTLSGTTLTLDAAPATSSEVVVHIIGDGVVGGGHTVNEFTGNGSTTDFTLTLAPMNENNTLVYLDGVYQHKSEYSVSGTTLSFSTAPANGDDIEVLIPTLTEINQPAASSIDDVAMFSGIQPSTITSTTVATTSATTIATHAIATYRTVKYLVQCTQGTDYHSTEINAIHDGTTVYITEYGTLFDNAALGTFDATISSGNLLLQITAGSATSMAVKVVSTAIPV